MGTGGARYGAGRPGWRRKCEQMLVLDVRRVVRASGYRTGAWQWYRGDEPAGSIQYRLTPDSMTLEYTWTPYGHDPVAMVCVVSLERTSCHYGGSRCWFCCPRCFRRCAILYGVAKDGRFGCRTCLRLGYTSETESITDRSWRKERKLEAKLADDCQRPKGMRQRTYQRLLAKLDENAERREEGIYHLMAQLLGRYGPK